MTSTPSHKPLDRQHGASPSSPQSTQTLPSRVSVSKTLKGKHILLTGVTGFLGKVYASMLLHDHPDIGQLYVLIRGKGRTQTAKDRFLREVVASPAFDPIRELAAERLQPWLEARVTIVEGDVTLPHLGLPLEEARDLSRRLDLFVHSAGLTNFNPNLRNSIEINTLSSLEILNFIRLGGSRAKLFHVSTSFVAGTQEGEVWETVPTETNYPNYDSLQTPYDSDREIEDCMKVIKHVESLAEDQERTSLFTKRARKTIIERNINPNDADRWDEVFTKEKSNWIRNELSQIGRKRAAHWGYVNIYTYSKSLGERLIVKKSKEIDYVIFRPAIIESSYRYPIAGWNEGVNTTSPIIFLSYKGHRFIPARQDLDLDIIPVDFVVGAMLSVSAALLQGVARPVYHCGSSHLSKLSIQRLIELTTLATRKLYDKRAKMPTWQRVFLKSIDSVLVSPEQFERHSAPRLIRVSKQVSGAIDKLPTKHMGSLGKALNVVRATAKQTEKVGVLNEKIFELFIPFIYENTYTFRMDHFLELRDMLEDTPDWTLYRFDVESFDWRHYWVYIHVPGLDRYAFDEMERKFRSKKKSDYSYQDLRELFESTTRNYPDNIAYQHHDGTLVESYTYAEVRDHSLRIAEGLLHSGFVPGSSILLVSENRPQWGMAYFGIINARGVAVPVDPDSSAGQIVNVVLSSGAGLVIASQQVLERLGDELRDQLLVANLKTEVVLLQSLFRLALPAAIAAAGGDAAPSGRGGVATATAPLPRLRVGRPLCEEHDIASLIYTSGTTGNPKGVLLTHRNFTSLINSLESLFTVTEKDGFLSVLPLHHTFEFSTGFLTPFAKGSTVTYLEELTAEELQGALKSTAITAIIGVPAVWQLLYRRINTKINSQHRVVVWLFDSFKRFNKELRERTGLNFGAALFAGIHAAFGNRIRYLISGGASLPKELMESYYSFGFNLYEGYGLTEAAPVLTANSPSAGLRPGSVGKPLDGVKVEILDPNDEGIGEVIAYGDNIMVGYLDQPEATEHAFHKGWLRTGDLGKIDRKGNLTIVGRSKECIVTSGGKNVYPDELEEFYGSAPKVDQFSIVGIPDRSGSERVAALFRIDPESYTTEEEYEEACEDVRAYLKVQGSRTATHNRLNTVRFTVDELPITSTRKVRRRDVARILAQMLQEEATHQHDDTALEQANWGWLDLEIAGLAGVDEETISFATHFQDDLGFDSLMVAELNATLEQQGYQTSIETLQNVDTVGELRELLSEIKKAPQRRDSSRGSSTEIIRSKHEDVTEIKEIQMPGLVRSTVRKLLSAGQDASYRDFFDVSIYGRAFIPKHNPNVIVVANHSSHLDMGLVKYALGEFGNNIRALAAADYFFSNTLRKTYFNQFTNLIPLERSGSLEHALGPAVDALRSGDTILLFPEGTRSVDGKLRSFRKGLGYLVATNRVDVLPLWIKGTHRALPKGQSLPSLGARQFTVRIGPLVSANDLLNTYSDRSGSSLYGAISDHLHDVIEGLSRAGVTSNSRDDLEDIINDLKEKFQENAIDQSICYYWTLGPDDKEKWTIIVDRDQCRIHQGKPSSGDADCVVKTTPTMFKRIVLDQYLPSFEEFMSGSIKTNSPELLAQFQNIFNLQG